MKEQKRKTILQIYKTCQTLKSFTKKKETKKKTTTTKKYIRIIIKSLLKTIKYQL